MFEVLTNLTVLIGSVKGPSQNMLYMVQNWWLEWW